MTHPGVKVARVLGELPDVGRWLWKGYRAHPWLAFAPFFLGVLVGALQTLHRLGKL